jgi:hypothetical protein
MTESSARNKLDSSYKDIAPPPHRPAVQRKLFSLVELFEDSIVFDLITEDDPVLQIQCNVMSGLAKI